MQYPATATHFDISSLRHFMSWQQRSTVANLCRGEEGQFFAAKAHELRMLIETMPKTYEQDGKGDEAVAYLHYFVGGCDWYITERDQETEQHQVFGIANIGYGPELGYISLPEILRCGAELDLHFTPATLASIKAKGRVQRA